MEQETQKQKTRARVIELLRRGRKTVDELAATLGLTDNAVRMHLAGLERAGLVRAEGVRRSGLAGKPAAIYEIAPEAEPGFSRAYAPVLATVVDLLGERLSEEEFDHLMRAVGRRLAAGQTAPTGNLLKRVKAASALLNQLGAVTTVESLNGHGAVMAGAACPLGVAVAKNPNVCHAVQELLAVLVDAEVQACCQRGERPACRFHFSEP
jgi:predicted ArsR family transcriptional regulator